MVVEFKKSDFHDGSIDMIIKGSDIKKVAEIDAEFQNFDYVLKLYKEDCRIPSGSLRRVVDLVKSTGKVIYSMFYIKDSAGAGYECEIYVINGDTIIPIYTFDYQSHEMIYHKK